MNNNLNTISSDFNKGTKSNFIYGWECPRCGRINAPWKSSCDCNSNNRIDLLENVYCPEGDSNLNLYSNAQISSTDPCKNCSNNSKNGGSGNCNCILGIKDKVIC